MFRKNTEKYVTFTVPIEKEVTRTDKNGEEIAKTMYIIQVTIYDSTRFRTTHYQILLITLLKEFKKLDTMVKNVKLVELNAKIATIFLISQTLKMI